MRPIDADALLDKFLRHYTEQEKKGNLSFVACEIKQSFADMVNEAPTLTADDYFDAVDRIKPCPNCRYTLLGALTEDEHRWIPVTERLPDTKKDESVLVVCDYHGKIAVETRKMWNIDSSVTHWMPLPEPPKENEP